MIFFCAYTFTDSRRTSTTNFYSESRACFSPKNMKYLEIIAPDIVPVMNKGITHHQVLFTLFPSPRKKPPEHNILNAWWFLCWEMDGIFFVCLLYVMSTISASITACNMPRCGADATAIATSFSCNMSMMILTICSRVRELFFTCWVPIIKSEKMRETKQKVYLHKFPMPHTLQASSLLQWNIM